MTKLYLLYLDGQLYGAGNGDYMVELIKKIAQEQLLSWLEFDVEEVSE